MVRIKDGAQSEPFRLADSASHLLHRAEQLAADRFTQLVGDAITLRQFAVLAAVHENPGLSQSDLVRATGVDRSTMADMIARLEKRGWLLREASNLDGRAHAVSLTDDGVAILASATHHARAADAAILDSLARTKRRTFLNILTKLARAYDEAAEKAERKARREAKRKKAAEKKKKPPKRARA